MPMPQWHENTCTIKKKTVSIWDKKGKRYKYESIMVAKYKI